jgi:hypothetical protein
MGWSSGGISLTGYDESGGCVDKVNLWKWVGVLWMGMGKK